MLQPKLGIPDGTYDLKIGKSFSKSSKNRQEYHTLRYDFKPKSVSAEQEAHIAISSNDDVHISFANDTADSLTMYKGASKPLKDGKECLLIFDEDRGEMRLEKVVSNLNVKQTRGVSDEVEQAIRSEIDTKRRHESPYKRSRHSPGKRRLPAKNSSGNSASSSKSSPTKSIQPKPSTQPLHPTTNKASKPPAEVDLFAEISSSDSLSSSEEEDGEIVEDSRRNGTPKLHQNETPKSIVESPVTGESSRSSVPRRYDFEVDSRSTDSPSSDSSENEFAAEIERRINAASTSPEPTATRTTNDDDDMPDLFGSSFAAANRTTPEKPSTYLTTQTHCLPSLANDLELSDTSESGDDD